jgi:Helix-turn-helix of DDE superfamily endonuclease
MLNIRRVLDNERLLRSLTGLNRPGFDKLCEVFGEVYDQALQSDPKPRQRARGGGRKARLGSVEAKLFFILFYFKVYPTFDVLGWLFDLERGRCNLYIRGVQILKTH